MKVTLTRITEDPIMAIEEAASNCYDSNPSKEGKIMKHCISSGHTSVTEFCTFTFHIEGVSRALLAQITRHRHMSFAVRSQRYCNEDGFGYVTPPLIQNDYKAFKLYKDFMDACQSTYKKLQELGIRNEDARFVLPNACETVLEVSMNLRELMLFMNERLCMCAQWEIRHLAQLMKREVLKEVPQLDSYLVPKCEKYGKDFAFCTESSKRSCHMNPLKSEWMRAYDELKNAEEEISNYKYEKLMDKGE